MTAKSDNIFKEAALNYHKYPKPGKIGVHAIKPLFDKYDLSLAYSPGVAEPCKVIHENPELAYEYTAKGNLVAVISNGTAVLGLGTLHPLASKPVMEGKAVLFKKFAGIDSIDIEVNSLDVEDIIRTVRNIGDTFGGINLEDIASPQCFEIEERLKKELDIPVFHDDQHGTAIITLAGMRNACEISGKKMSEVKLVMSGAGAAGIACLELLIKGGLNPKNVIICDRKGVIYKGRKDEMTPTKERYATESQARTISEAMAGADVFIGLSVKGVISKEMIASMAPNPIIFAMANPDPEITPEEVLSVRTDAIIATGRSDYPNQVNNVMGFPYIFRGALDVRAKVINEEMKLAAAKAIANLAKQPVPISVKKAYPDRVLEYGSTYIIPTPFDPRLIVEVSSAVARAAVETGVARKKIDDWAAYEKSLMALHNPAINMITGLHTRLKQNPKRIIFAEGEELEVIRAALEFRDEGLGTPILVGKREKILETAKSANVDNLDGIEIANAAISKNNQAYIDFLFQKLGRKGYLYRDCERMVKTDRNIFASCMLALGDGDGLVTGVTRGYQRSLDEVSLVIDKKADEILFGVSALLTQDNNVIFVADTAINETLSAQDLCLIAKRTATKARVFGIEPRVAFISYSNFGSRSKAEDSIKINKMHEAVGLLNKEAVDFVYDGEMTISVALSDNPRTHYPFNKLDQAANVLIMSDAEVSSVALGLLKSLGNTHIIGSILTGFEKSVQVVRLGSDSNNILNMAIIAGAYS